jgi:predicted lipoprotein with Yx(FWY)xxD motif
MNPKRFLTSGIVIAAAALALGACGGGSSSSGSDGGSTAASTGASSSGSAKTVSVSHVDGAGDVLVDGDGMALYTPEQEADGTIVCTGGCLSFWRPLTPSGGRPTADGDAGSLGVVKRPDGMRQVTANGKPLYTFTEDAAGQVTGDGFSDSFDGRDFTWHVVVAGGEPSSSAPGAASNGGGGASDDGYSANGY